MTVPQTWHHGLIADWWAEFNTDGPEIDYYRRFIEDGQPALDAGCGTGRLLLPWLRAGLDVDGCDVSADMIERCRARARADGLEPTLWTAALHELDPPRRYRTIVLCGVFGIGTTREQDQEGLRRCHDALEPGGTLLLDNEVPYSVASRWRRWTKEERDALPAPWPESGTVKVAADGSEFELRARTTAVDPLDQTVWMEMRAEKRREGQVVASEEAQPISLRSYFRDEIVLMLGKAGFADVVVRGGYTDAEPSPDDDFLVFVAKR